MQFERRVARLLHSGLDHRVRRPTQVVGPAQPSEELDQHCARVVHVVRTQLARRVVPSIEQNERD